MVARPRQASRCSRARHSRENDDFRLRTGKKPSQADSKTRSANGGGCSGMGGEPYLPLWPIAGTRNGTGADALTKGTKLLHLNENGGCSMDRISQESTENPIL